MTSSRVISQALSIVPIHLICDNHDFIYRLVGMLLTETTTKKERKKICRKMQSLARRMDEALSDCINMQDDQPFRIFLQNLSTSFSKKQFSQILQECRRHLNSMEVNFTKKFQTDWKWGGMRWVSEGNLLAKLNNQFDQAIQDNETNGQTYSIQDICDAVADWFFSLDLRAIVAVGGVLFLPKLAQHLLHKQAIVL